MPIPQEKTIWQSIWDRKVLLCCMVTILYLIIRLSTVDHKELKDLNAVIKQKTDSIKIIEHTNIKLKDSLVFLDGLKRNNEQKITNINNYYDQKVNTVTSYDNDSIQWFFRNRYQR